MNAPLYAEYDDGELVLLGELIYDEVIEEGGLPRLHMTGDSPRVFEFPHGGTLRDVFFLHRGDRVGFNIPDPALPPRDVVISSFELSDEDPFK